MIYFHTYLLEALEGGGLSLGIDVTSPPPDIAQTKAWGFTFSDLVPYFQSRGTEGVLSLGVREV